MAVTYHQFVAEFPEFSRAPETMIEAKIAQATRRIDSDVWGAVADDGVRYLAAHLLSMHPASESARKAGGGATSFNDESTYFREYRRLMRMVAVGFRVT